MVKVAFVGCGAMMEAHARRLGQLPGVVLVGCCDRDARRAEDAAKAHGGEAFTDPATMFDKAKPHAAYICVPPGSRGPMEAAAAQRGIHLFLEKPVGLSRRTARTIAAAARTAGIIVSVGYCYRYLDTVQRAKKELKGHPVTLVRGCWAGPMPEVSWWRRTNESGGQIFDETTHLIDMVRYLCGDVAEVHAVSSRGCMNKVEDFDIDDSSALALRLKSGAAATLASTCVLNRHLTPNGHPGVGVHELEIFTPDAIFRLEPTQLTIIDSQKRTAYAVQVDPLLEENRAFIETVETGKRGRIRSTCRDAIRTLHVSCAAVESMKTGLPAKP